MPRISALTFVVTAIMSSLITYGCGGSKPARFYLLQSEASDQRSTSSSDAGDIMLIGMMPVSMPDYLMRPQIASRAGGHRIEYAEYDRWAEPLHDTIARLVSHDLEEDLPGFWIVAHPWMANLELEYRLNLELEQFDLYEDGSAVLKGTWSVGAGRAGSWIGYGSFDLSERFEEEKKPDYPVRVAALNRLVTRMNRQLVEEVRAFLQTRSER